MTSDRFDSFILTIRKGIDRLGFDRVLLFVLGAAVLGLLALGMGKSLYGGDENDARVTFFQIGTGSTGGTYFPMGEALAAVISRPPGSDPCIPGGRCGVPGLVAISKGSAGSVANARAVADGRLDSALVQANVLEDAFHGRGAFEGEPPRENLRVIANLYVEAIHLVTARGLDINGVEDLKGLRVSIGSEGSGTRADAISILKAFGVSLADIEPVSADASRSAELILSGNLDAYFLVAGAPARSIEDLAVRGAIDIVPIEGEPADRLRIDRTYYSNFIIPENTYRFVGDVKTIGIGALWITRSTTNSDLVHAITRALFDDRNRDTLVTANANGRHVNPNAAVQGVPILIHPGAELFYFEKGILER
ncbi:MAG: TAXI family TRAP transporter solute-binding subunit [Rhodobiaceae bacterium]|nr:TAXI family TRAP transporter solute-binding subunit [Rhodobiaceae bacterium]